MSNNFGFVIEALQEAKVSFIITHPCALLGPMEGCGDPVLLEQCEVNKTEFKKLVDIFKKVKPDTLCFVSDSSKNKQANDNTIYYYFKPIATIQSMIDLEAEFIRGIACGNNILYRTVAEFMEADVTIHSWLNRHSEFLLPPWTNYPKLPESL